MSRQPRYVLITPCRDEEAHAHRTLESVVRQTCPPAQWVIVDDGSRDGTPAILSEYASRHPWIRVMRREDRGGRSVGPGVIEAFEAGWRAVRDEGFDYLGKLDLDLGLPRRYFEILLGRMELDPRLGTCSGKPYYVGADGEVVREACGDEMSVGMTKLYRRSCFEEIGGFVRAVMWDGIDCHRCRILGWKATSFDEPELRFLHLRPMGSSDGGIWCGRVRHGRGQYFMGTGPAYMAASVSYRLMQPPRFVGGLAMGWGWIRAFLERAPRYEDREFRRFLRRYQRECLLLGKRRATARLDERQAARWRERAPKELALEGQPS